MGGVHREADVEDDGEEEKGEGEVGKSEESEFFEKMGDSLKDSDMGWIKKKQTFG